MLQKVVGFFFSNMLLNFHFNTPPPPPKAVSRPLVALDPEALGEVAAMSQAVQTHPFSISCGATS